MRTDAKRLICAITFVFFLAVPVFSADIIERDDLLNIFAKHKVSGTFVVFDSMRGQYTITNQRRAFERKIPASTFKIANSIIALETGAIKDENEIIPYGGNPQPIKIWEQDMTLPRAFEVSNVPVYQELAQRIGIKHYQTWLRKLNYGNGEIGEEITRFWLDGPLKISAVEQVDFLSRLVAGDLPISTRNQRIVREIAKIETQNGKTLFGKTGWTITPSPQLGWFVGWVESKNGSHTFALNIDINSRDDVKKSELLARLLLLELGIY